MGEQERTTDSERRTNVGKKVKKIITITIIVGAIVLALKVIASLFGFFKGRNLANEFAEMAEKENEKAQKKKEEADKLKKERQGIKNKYSKIIPIILILMVPMMCFSEYLVWDSEEEVMRDYGTEENYVKASKEIIPKFVMEVKMLREANTSLSNAYHFKSIENDALKRTPFEIFWEKNDQWVFLFIGVFGTVAIINAGG